MLSIHDEDELGGTATVRQAEEQQSDAWSGDVVGHDDAGDELPARLGIGRSIRPGAAVPSTVLVSNMSSGALYLDGLQQGPSAYLTPQDATPLKRELARAFGSDSPVAQDTKNLSS